MGCIRYSLIENIEHLIIIFSRLRNAVLKLNFKNRSIGLKHITYLGYVITWEGMKPYTKNLQGIMDLRIPNNKNEQCLLVFMFRYYK